MENSILIDVYLKQIVIYGKYYLFHFHIMIVNIYDVIESLQAEVVSLKKQTEEISSCYKTEIDDLKEIVNQMKSSFQEKESCQLSYFGPKQGNYPYASWHVEANKETRLPLFVN